MNDIFKGANIGFGLTFGVLAALSVIGYLQELADYVPTLIDYVKTFF